MTTNKLELTKPESTELNIEKSSNVMAFILLSVALIALSFTAIFIKLSVREISANATVFNRLWIATIIFGLWNGINELRTKKLTDQKLDDQIIPKEPYQLRDIILLVAVAVVHVVGRVLWSWSLTQTTAANATVLSNLPPLFTTLGAWLILGKTFNRRFVIGMVIALAGAFTLGLDDFFWSENLVISQKAIIGDAAALLSSVFYAASFLMIERLRTRLPVQNILVWRCFLGTLFILPVVLTFEEQIFPISWFGWLTVFGLAAICEVLGHGLVVYSLKYLSSSFVTIFLLLEPVMTAILAWFIFSESLSLVNLLALSFILQGIYLAKTGKGADKE
ncbi:MAG: DMT family transporter [Dolichospermum sp. DET50]|nr:DMT family transporter [Dolichospermum sp. DET66]MBS3035724.1 DMT family transporter [Dolichospermum sp. DET67]MBS3040926.1 DMT family transporter [Dolichospermum sp. DET50]QSX68035.1 MAG: DMT family transporter [Dolichospermum sp. DET69]